MIFRDSLVPRPRLVGSAELRAPLKGIAGASYKKLHENLGLETLEDLLRHYPRRYLVPSELTELDSLPVDELVTVVADVVRASSRKMKERRGEVMQVIVGDGVGTLELTFFGYVRPHLAALRPGRRGVFSGKVSMFRGVRQLTHPTYTMIDDDGVDLHSPEAAELRARPIPIYRASGKLTSTEIAGVVRVAVEPLGDVADPVPADIRARHHLMDLTTAFRAVHLPRTMEEAYAAQKRFRYEEALVLQTALVRRRAAAALLPATGRRARPGGLLEAFDARLPFELTTGQQEVSREIADDIAREHPMHRLLQGEVGSGKTVVALRAMLTVVDDGGQAALLAPTEVLAVQHHRSMTAMLGELAEAGMLGSSTASTRVVLVTGSMTAAARRKALLLAASGDAGIVVGTHALLEERVQFSDLGLVVVDEQHRFGVEQRTALGAKARSRPHTLVMTATPIPRTVAMTVFGDLDVSTLTELPRGRSPIATHVVHTSRPTWVQRAWELVREHVDAGHQAFVVCPRIGDDHPTDRDLPRVLVAKSRREQYDEEMWGLPEEEPDPARPRPAAAQEVLEQLREEPALAGVRLEMLHGRMTAEDRDDVMGRFTAGQIDVLVATTVVEVGVDVPNATAMVIVDADRFGVSQLHQMRGRVGRGRAASVCLLMTGVDENTPAAERLTAVAGTIDGFELARVDLEARREGDVLGSHQSGGRSSLRLLRVLRDGDVISAMRQEAVDLIAADPRLLGHPALARAIDDQIDPDQEAYLDRG